MATLDVNDLMGLMWQGLPRSRQPPELEAAGAFDDNLTLGSGGDDIDRQLHELTSQSAVDDDLAKMKAELGVGGAAGELGAGEATGTVEPESGEQSSQERPA